MKNSVSAVLCCIFLLGGSLAHGAASRANARLADLAPDTTVMEFFEGPGSLKEIGINEGPGSFKEIARVLFETNLDTGLSRRALTGSSEYTLFAPTDAAFRQFGRIGFLRSQDTANPDSTKQKYYIKFAQYHLCQERISAREIRERLDRKTYLPTIAGNLDPKDLGKVLYSIELLNGTIHVIERVLIHPDLRDYLRIK